MNQIVYPDNWDPDPGSKDWFHHWQTGDRGWRVRRDGKWKIHLDRKDDPIREFREGVWVSVSEVRPMSRGQVTQVAYEADRALCRALGIQSVATKEWLSLTPDRRREWIEVGPDDDGLRRELYKAIMGVIGRLA